MEQDVIIVDDAISKQYQNLIIDSIVNNKNFPWYFNQTITRNQNFNNSKEDSYGFAHQFFTLESGSTSYITQLLLPLLYESCDKIGQSVTSLLAGRCFMTFPVEGRANDINDFHVDVPGVDHLVCLYYINDSTGDTVISSIKETDITDIKNIDKNEMPILKRVTPKQGRCVFFNGKYYHASSVPEQNNRCIINFDYV